MRRGGLTLAGACALLLGCALPARARRQQAAPAPPRPLDVWRAGAPQVDFLSPAIYFPSFVEWARRYQVSGNPLFTPEVRLGPQSSVRALYAFGRHDAICSSPFSIESGEGRTGELLAAGYDLAEQLTPLIVERQGRHIRLPSGRRDIQRVKLYRYR